MLKKFLKTINQDTIKDNIVIIYEVIDEIIDFGYIQMTDYN